MAWLSIDEKAVSFEAAFFVCDMPRLVRGPRGWGHGLRFTVAVGPSGRLPCGTRLGRESSETRRPAAAQTTDDSLSDQACVPQRHRGPCPWPQPRGADALQYCQDSKGSVIDDIDRMKAALPVRSEVKAMLSDTKAK